MAKRAGSPRAQYRDMPLEDWPDEAREQYLGGQPKRVQAYITNLEEEIRELEEEAAAEQEVLDFDESLAHAWHTIGCTRLAANDRSGAFRAFRAEKIARYAP